MRFYVTYPDGKAMFDSVRSKKDAWGLASRMTKLSAFSLRAAGYTLVKVK